MRAKARVGQSGGFDSRFNEVLITKSLALSPKMLVWSRRTAGALYTVLYGLGSVCNAISPLRSSHSFCEGA
jgi:hypothetical protein